jgi:hypothetical protein
MRSIVVWSVLAFACNKTEPASVETEPSPAVELTPSAPSAPPSNEPAPSAPGVSPEQAASQKTSAIAERCVNRFSGRIRDIRANYLARADREDGPERLDTVAAGIFYLPGDQVPDCRTAIDGAVALTPAVPAFDQAAPVYASALEAVVPVLADASNYYQRQAFNDDDGAHARELHTQLLGVLDAFVAADDALSRVAQDIELGAVESLVRRLEADPSQRGMFLLERARACAMRTLQSITALEIVAVEGRRRAFHFAADDRAALMTSVEECQRFVDEMRAAPEAAQVDTGGSYRTDANDYVAAATIVARAVRDDTTYTSEAEPGGLVNRCVEEYNSLVGDYNRL